MKNKGREKKQVNINVVLTAYKQTSQEDFTHIFKTVGIDVPDDGNEWHVAGEEIVQDEQECSTGEGDVSLDEEDNQVDEPEWDAYEPHTEPQKKERHTRNESLFGTGWKGNNFFEEDNNPDGAEQAYKGFLYIRCDDCGEVKGFCARDYISEYTCKCGGKTKLKNLKRMFPSCECGKDFKYHTNVTDEQFEYRCLDCGSPVDLILNKRRTAYITLDKNRRGGGSGKSYDYGYSRMRNW